MATQTFAKVRGRFIIFVLGLIGGLLASAFTSVGSLLANDIYPWLKQKVMREAPPHVYHLLPDSEYCGKPSYICHEDYDCSAPAFKTSQSSPFAWSSIEKNVVMGRIVCTIPGPVKSGKLVSDGARVATDLSAERVIGRVGVREHQLSDFDLQTYGTVPGDIASLEFRSPRTRNYHSEVVSLKIPDRGVNQIIVVIEFNDAWRKNRAAFAVKGIHLELRS